MGELTESEIRALDRVNGVQADEIDAIGPFISGNGCRWWLVRAVVNSRTLMFGDNEYAICREPATTAWGWDIDLWLPFVHYAFADACKRLLGGAY